MRTALSVRIASRTGWITALLLILLGSLPAQTLKFEAGSTQPDEPTVMTVGPDRALWFGLITTDNVPAIGRMTTNMEYTKFTFPMMAIDSPNGITSSSSDGTLWCTESTNDMVDHLSLSGELLGQYPVSPPPPPFYLSQPALITAGPDKGVWFLEEAGRIGRIDEKTYIMQEWTIPLPPPINAGYWMPGAIVTGPDGALWFSWDFYGVHFSSCTTECSGVGTFNPQTQAFTMYPMPSLNDYITDLAVGTDGNLWVGLDEGDGPQAVAKITTAGAITKVYLPGTAQPLGMTAGPDGAMWFTAYATPGSAPFVLGRITPDGVEEVFDTPADSRLRNIVGYPGDGLWLPDNDNPVGDPPGVLHAIISPDPAELNRQQQGAPIKLGTSGSNINDSDGSNCRAGTLGSLVSKVVKGQTVTYILSNNHVLAQENKSKKGTPIIQRGYVDTAPPCSSNGTVTVATLADFQYLHATGANYYDAAIAQTGCSGCVKVDPKGTILEIGPVSSATALPEVGMNVMKAGRKTGYSSGSIDATHVTINVAYDTLGVLKFKNQVTIIPPVFSGPGDSGSLVVNTTRNPVGLLFAGSAVFTLASPVGPVLSRFGVTFVGTSAAATNQSPGVGDTRIEAASRVKDRYDDYLLQLPEAQGHGVGYASGGSGQAVIKLFVRKATDVARKAAPRSLEGIPVEIVEAGEFKAY
jgi:virginiamycin B lyase